MTEKKLLIVGSGKRVCEDALPALMCLQEFRIHKIFARKARTIQVHSEEFAVESIHHLGEADIRQADLVYVAVKQPGVVDVLTRLTRYDCKGVDLLVETPVLPFNDLAKADLFTHFRNVWVAEDCTRLPCFDLLSAGEATEVYLDRSGYKYHAIALSKMLLGCREIASAERSSEHESVLDTLRFANGGKAVIRSPRDYGNGTLSVQTKEMVISDVPGGDARTLDPVVAYGTCTGFVAGERKSVLSESETRLLGSWQQNMTMTFKMHDLKRVGLYRMFKDILEDRGSYPLEEGLHDMAVSFYLDHTGCYRKGSVLNHSSKTGRLLTGLYVKIKNIIRRFK